MVALVGEIAFPRKPEHASPARREVTALIAKAVTDDHTIEAVAAAAAEILANSIRHGAGDEMTVRVLGLGTALRIEVSDSYTGPITAATTDPLGETGRGMTILDALADQWGLERDRTGTTAWFEVALP